MADSEHIKNSPEVQEIPFGYCHCGCGQKTNLASQNHTEGGWTKGQPMKYIHGHNFRGINWRNRRCESTNGYILIYKPEHPRASNGYVPEHILTAERAFGKPLPSGAIVHHANGSKNSGPLVICQDRAYHMLLHQRMRAHKACGHAHWHKCPYCKEYDDPTNMVINKRLNKRQYLHSACRIQYLKAYYAKNRDHYLAYFKEYFKRKKSSTNDSN
jgi:hypothetical protein